MQLFPFQNQWDNLLPWDREIDPEKFELQTFYKMETRDALPKSFLVVITSLAMQRSPVKPLRSRLNCKEDVALSFKATQQPIKRKITEKIAKQAFECLLADTSACKNLIEQDAAEEGSLVSFIIAQFNSKESLRALTKLHARFPDAYLEAIQSLPRTIRLHAQKCSNNSWAQQVLSTYHPSSKLGFPLNQACAIDKIIAYLRLINLQQNKPLESEIDQGLCFGIGLLYAYHFFIDAEGSTHPLNAEQLFDSLLAKLEKNQLAQLTFLERLCLLYYGSILFDEAPITEPNALYFSSYSELKKYQVEIEHLVNDILFLQGRISACRQVDPLNLLCQLSNQVSKLQSQFRHISNYPYDKTSHSYFSLEQDLEQLLAGGREKWIIILTRSHLMSLFFRNGTCFLFDPAQKTLPTLHQTDDAKTIQKAAKALAREIETQINCQKASMTIYFECFAKEPLAQLEVTKAALQEKVRLGKDLLGLSPLHLASGFGCTDIIERLLEQGAAIEDKNHAQLTSLMQAALADQVSAIKLLLEKGALIDQTDQENRTAFWMACQNNSCAAMQVLQQAGCEKANLEGMTPLACASYFGNLAAIKLLLTYNAAIESLDAQGYTPLMHAAQEGHSSVVQLLCEAGANISALSIWGETPLFIAARGNHIEIAQYLIHKGSSIHQTNFTGATPLLEAASKGCSEMLYTLIQAGAVVNCADVDGNTPLHMAAKNGHLDAVRLLIERAADVNLANKNLGTPLFIAASRDQGDVCDELVLNGASLKGKALITPLETAVFGGHYLSTTALLKYIFPLSKARDKQLLWMAAFQGYADIVCLLLQAGADVNLADSLNQTALYKAVYNAKADAVEDLLVQGHADHSLADTHGRSPLWIAANYGHLEIVKILLRQQANAHQKDHQGISPLDIATQNSHRQIAALLSNR